MRIKVSFALAQLRKVLDLGMLVRAASPKFSEPAGTSTALKKAEVGDFLATS